MPPARFRRSAPVGRASAEAEGDQTVRLVNKTLVQIMICRPTLQFRLSNGVPSPERGSNRSKGRRRAAWTTAKSFSSIRMRS